MLRLPRYQGQVRDIRDSVTPSRKAELDAGIVDPSVSRWEPASRLLGELNRVFDAAIAPIEPKTQEAGAGKP